MRKRLQDINKERARFTATFGRFGTKSGWRDVPVQTVLVNEIRDASGKIVADHLWLNLTKGFEQLNLQQGDRIQFDARVKHYIKGYQGRHDDVFKPIELDYKLSHPTKLQIISRQRIT